LKFRNQIFVLCGDIGPMYPNIQVAEQFHGRQQILCRDIPVDPVRLYRLTTLTFGFRISSYLACRSLKFVADRWAEKQAVKESAKILVLYG
jgi:hypothetical protein